MAGARGDALDWALALARAPAERMVLRQRPLPEGIDALLQIAAGHRGEALSSAVARSGESEQDLVEAVRFYLREVLFHSNADAYRLLGLERSATTAEIKSHHRWLQQWLHPDRHTSDWDAIFAGRVNAAWNELRSQERRQTYDAEHASARPASPDIPLSPILAGWANPATPLDSPRERWLRRWPLLALLVACLALGVMALRDLARDEALLASETPGSVPTAHDDPGERGDAALDTLGNLHIPKRVARAADKALTAKPTAPRKPSGVTRSVPVVKTASAILAPRARAPSPQPAATVVTAAPTRSIPAQSARRTPPLVASAPLPAVAVPPSAVTRAPKVTAFPAPASRSIEVAPPPVAETPAVAVVPTAPQRKTPVTAERVRNAQQVGDRLVAYMGKPGTSTPPIWDSPATLRGAAELRDVMLAEGSPEMAQADWRVGENEARMRVAVRHSDGGRGHLDAVLVWREQRWLVRRLSMERDR